MIRKLLLTVVFGTLSAIAMAQTITTHVVQRGETAESIATLYSITTEQLFKANPGAEDLFYVGLKLNIPEKKVAQKQPTATTVVSIQTDSASNTSKNAVVQSSNKPMLQSTKTSRREKSNLNIKAIAGVTFGTWVGKDFKDGKVTDYNEYSSTETKNKANYQFHIGAITDYYFTKNLYTGLGIVFNKTGYKQSAFATSGQYWVDEGGNYDMSENVTMSVSKLDIPIHIGGTYNISQDSRLFIEVGPYLSFALNGSKKRKGERIYYEDIHSSSTEHISEKEKLDEGSLKDYNKFGYGLSVTAGISFKNFILQCTYQRELNKTIKKKKEYEQNILLSLGYEF